MHKKWSTHVLPQVKPWRVPVDSMPNCKQAMQAHVTNRKDTRMWEYDDRGNFLSSHMMMWPNILLAKKLMANSVQAPDNNMPA